MLTVKNIFKQSVFKQFSKLSPLQRFLLKALMLFLIWQVLYVGFIGRSGYLDYAMTDNVGQTSANLMTSFGLPSVCEYVPNESRFNAVRIKILGKSSIFIADGCNGLTIMALFAGFILAAPGIITNKLWFIPLGILVIYSTNILRVIFLSVNYYQHPETFEFNHKYTYAIVVYAVVFGLWMWWMNRFSGLKSDYAR